MIKRTLYSTLIILTTFLFIGCTESFPLVTNTYEEALVVEATITNELKNQEIKITKSAKFEDEQYLSETGAEVYITDDSGKKYDFEEQSEKYISKIAFEAVPNVKYQLHINTKDGRSFESAIENLPAINPMQSVEAKIETKDSIRGVGIRVHSLDPQNQSKYYRFEYEETYKIVTPKWVPTKAIINENGRLSFIPNSNDTKVCYGNKKSIDLMLTNTTNLTEDRVNYLIRFISDQDYIITTRYSIIVRQYVQNLAAYNYYSTLKKISNSGTVLSPTQPGFLQGNIKSIKNPSNKVVGFFDVASVSTERIYFNYKDLFPNELPPPYYTDCKEYCFADWPYTPDPCTHSGSYLDDLSLENITYFLTSNYLYWVNSPCGDCTVIASNVKPPFWID